uniref:Pentatricopeptide repeat-containing protein 1, mitochondrial n=1 Tax=Diabrotica virgifera virgifera TaxID=50390 RepID=A0A6P7F786_DIAVI
MFRTPILRCIRQLQLLENTIKTTVVHTTSFQLQTTSLYKHAEKSELTKNKPSSSDHNFLVKLKSDPDTFGTQQEEDPLVEDDVKEEKYFTEKPLRSQKLSTKQYADIIKDLIRKRKIKEAIDVVEVRMLKEDRVKPESYIYNLLLGACGRVGYTKKAFMLYNDMKKRGLKISPGSYTALFNACANSPWPLTDGLKRATHLREIMIEKGYQPNDTNYNVMIKAFGRCGDLPMAFSLVDEMRSKKIRIRDETINFLLQSCISDKEAGFRHALLVWRKLVDKHIKPSIYTFNLLLRCVRDCNMGDVETTKDVIDTICKDRKIIEVPNIKQLEEGNSRIPPPPYEIQTTESTNSNENQTLQVQNHLVDIVDSRPNLLAKIPHMGNIISLTEVKEPEHRLLLLGGCRGFLEEIKIRGCSPDIKTFTQLLDCIPDTVAAEQELLSSMKKFYVKPDLDFFNMLIKKRNMRSDSNAAKDVLRLIKKNGYRPDLITYGVLALGCTTEEDCVQLITEMKEGCYTLNTEILGAMLSQACYHMNIKYVMYLMDLCLTENVQPNKKFIEKLSEFKANLYNPNIDKTSSFIKNKALFKIQYKKWLNEVRVDDSENVHPWQQFRETNDNEHKYKPKDTARFKPRRLSLFKVKTSTKVRH